MAEYYEAPVAADLQATEKKIVNTSLTALPEPYISGLKLNADISLNGLTLNTIDENDVLWVVSDVDGWWSLPESEVPDLPRGFGDGSYDSVGRWATRLITLTGSFLPQKPSDAAAARNSLIQALTMVKTGGWLIVYEDKADYPTGNGKAAYVRLSGAPQITSVNARGRHDFSVLLKAADPLKYEYIDANPDGYNTATATLGSEVVVNNTGNVAVPAIFVLTGGVTADSNNYVSILNNTTVKSINLIANVSSALSLEVDTYNREILSVTPGAAADGSDLVQNARSTAEVLVDWIYLEPGLNTIKYLDVDGTVNASASCEVLWRSGWIG
tara:strand:+ start:847 stop:1827 length:981 start_codon:yes stop_codon:yes gene_type:complete